MKKVGILTFHCSDNYGAMLQAYALKTYLRRNNYQADLIRYEPISLLGKHWLFPYTKQKTPIHTAYWSFKGFVKNLKKGNNFFEQRKNMQAFREKYIYDSDKKVSKSQLEDLDYNTLIVGSDQIWSPSITHGLDSAYFGAFTAYTHKNVISYAASMGGKSLPAKYDKDMKEMLKNLNNISVREKEAIEYLKQFTDKEITEVLDPVFLLRKEDWQVIETKPAETDYILIYETFPNKDLEDKAKELAKKEGLKVIRINPVEEANDPEIIENYTSGPSEFIGYINNAKYVFTNSFHATAFSIILEKQFVVFLLENIGLRLKNVLENFDLLDRIDYDNLHKEINWEQVDEKYKLLSKESKNFLLKNI